MSFRAIQRILGLLLMVFSLSMLPPVGVALFYGDGGFAAFLAAFGWLLAVGAAIWWPVRRDRRDLRLRDGFVVVTLFWTVLGIAGDFFRRGNPQRSMLTRSPRGFFSWPAIRSAAD